MASSASYLKNGTSKVWKNLGSLALIVALFVTCAYGLRWAGLFEGDLTDIILLTGALISLGVTAVFNIYSSGALAYHRHGFELCALTLGTAISLLTAQLISGDAILPRLGQAALGIPLTQAQQVSLVALFGFGSVIGLGMTALIVRALEVEQQKPRFPNGLSFVSFLIGVAMIFGYVLLLLGAGA